MPSFGHTSEEKLKTVHPQLVFLLRLAIKQVDFTVLEGHRSPERQAELYEAKKTKVRRSKHNESPSHAVDIAPWPVDWDNRERFFYLAGVMKGIASEHGIPLRWGGDWDMDGESTDNDFDDLPHFELRSV